LAEAKTTRTASILLDQVQGAFRRGIEAVIQCDDSADVEKQLAAIDRYSALGRHLTKPWKVVVAGAPNVGKSSLVNALAGYHRSIVAPMPGTTRDVLTTPAAFDGWPVELADTAGVRTESEALEAEGINLALGAARSADLCLWILDGSTATIWPSSQLRAVQLVINKIDLPPAWDYSSAGEAVSVSALIGTGITELADAIAHRLVPSPPLPGAAVPFTEPLQKAVAEALTQCRAGQLSEAKRILVSLLGPDFSA
jgi:tRNA modification GTPase